jgi:GAF domain-containing protein/CheY-like chemotaxis protein
VLRRPDLEVVAASSGSEALEVLLERDVAVAILDVMMPEMDGFELADLIRGVERTRRVPIIFVTAGSKAEYKLTTGYETGAIDFLFKPLDERALLAKVDVLVALERQQREAEQARAETAILLEFAQATSQAESPEQIYNPALDAVRDLLGAERSAILLFDESDRMRFRAWRGLSDSYRAIVDGHSPWSRAERDPTPILIADVAKDDRMAAYRSAFTEEGIGAIAFVPLVSQGLLGKFMLYWDEPRAFSKRDERIAFAIALQIAEALARASLRDRELRALDRLAVLQRVTAILNAAATNQTIIGSLPLIYEAIGATTGGVTMLSTDGRELETLGTVGPPPEVVEQARRHSVESDLASAEAVRTRQPVFVDGTQVVLPLLIEDRVLGAIAFGFSTWRVIPSADRPFLLAVAGQFAQALDRARLLEAERRSREEAQRAEARRAAIQAVSEAALSHLEIDPLMTELLARVRRIFSCDTATILRLDAERGHVVVRACDGIAREAWDRIGVPYGAGVAGTILAERRPIVVDDVAAASIVSPILKSRLSSMAGVPLILDRGVMGVLHVGTFAPRKFSESDVQLLEMVAARVAVALDRANAYDALRVAEERLRVALSAGRMGVWEWSLPDGRVTWSPTLERIHGLEPGTFPGTFEAYQADVHPDDKDQLMRTVQETLAAGREHQAGSSDRTARCAGSRVTAARSPGKLGRPS